MCKDAYGRHRQPNSQQTWVYPVQYEAAGEKGSAFFKFQWGFKNDDEEAVHEFLLTRKVPHMPELRFSMHVTAKGPESDDWVCKGEAMLITGAQLSDAEIIDIFARHMHTLISAAAVDADNRYVLHRDISTRNLMIKNDKSPYIIDWGYGRLCVKDEKRLLSDKQMVVPTIYMGIRIINGCLSRSIIDCLESLFLVL
ncbi:hypothetical protein IWW36_001815 [Coemansia brasiliensis]|uniref:Uncharacterized protein n=1 Tax=Coemansia brasiliensis TaxID=2650707 RepID=A0A9W8IAV8_9FUNG|nr:hypothetical protein IWW36_001815 [Coemansia brasiliensis]